MKGTCNTKTSSSTIDYHIVYGGLQKGVKNVERLLGTCIKTHRPVTLTFHENLARLRMRKMKMPGKLEVEPVMGPHLKPPSYEVPKRLCKEAMAAAKDQRALSLQLLNTAFEKFADGAEIEVSRAVGSKLIPRQERGKAPKSTWSNLIQANDKKHYDVSNVLSEALEKVRDARDVAIDLKVFCNATGIDGGIDDLYDRAAKLEHLPYQGCTSKDPHDQFVFDGCSELICFGN